jgi:hypothetical protein
MAHVAGLVAAGVYPSPVPIADVTTTTTHKTLRGPRGGLILAKANPELEKKFNSLVFPGTQGGPLMHVIAAKAVAFKEALEPEFKDYQRRSCSTPRPWRRCSWSAAIDVVSGGTDNHLFLVSFIEQGLTGKDVDAWLWRRQHHRQQERGAERPAVALRHQRAPRRHAGHHHPRLRRGEAASWPAGCATSSTPSSGRRRRPSPRPRSKVLALCARFPVYGERHAR